MNEQLVIQKLEDLREHCQHCSDIQIAPNLATRILIEECIALVKDSVAPPASGTAWIPVSERLPERYVAVLTVIPEEDDHVSVAYLERDGSWTMVDHAEKAEHPITHWQPLPEPPSTTNS